MNTEGQIAIVHDAKPTNAANTPYHVNEADTHNWIRVNWDGGAYPGSSETSTCASHGCKPLADGSCLCETSVADDVVFTDLSSVSKEAVMSQLFQGALGPHADSSPTTGIDAGLTVHMVGGQLGESTVFEVQDKGRTLFLKNKLSTVTLEGWTMPPTIYEAEDATIDFAVSDLYEVSSCSSHFRDLDHVHVLNFVDRENNRLCDWWLLRRNRHELIFLCPVECRGSYRRKVHDLFPICV